MRLCFVTTRQISSAYQEVFHGASERLLLLLRDAGYVPLLLSHVTNMNLVSDLSPNLVVFTGGQSLGESPERDSFEFHLLQSCVNLQIPILGICRGMQLIAVHFGGTVQRVEGHVSAVHTIQGSFNGNVNSYHEFAIANVPPEFDVRAISPDGTIEAISNRERRCLGVMWHPERDISDVDLGTLLRDLMS